MTSLLLIALLGLRQTPPSPPRPVLSNVVANSACTTSLGSPSVTLSFDKRVISILLQGLTVSSPRREGARLEEASCRIRFDIQLPSGMRAELKAASYRFSFDTAGSGEAWATVRHGKVRRAWFDRWTSRVRKSAEGGDLVAPPGGPIRIGCGGKATLLLDVRLHARAGTGGEGLASFESIDFDAGEPSLLMTSPCT